MEKPTQAVLMCEAWADLHMRDGDVIPYFLQGHQFRPGDRFPGLDDFYVDMVEGLLSSTYIRQDNGEPGSWPEVITAPLNLGKDSVPEAKPGASCQAGRIIRRAEICYATLRYELIEMEWLTGTRAAAVTTQEQLDQ